MDYAQNELIIIEFGKNIVRLREKKNLKQRELAELAGLSTNALYEIEKGIVNTSLTTIYALAVALELPPAELMPPVSL